MLERVVHLNGLVTYQSPLLQEIGVTHAFSTRVGGMSEGPFASLNLGAVGNESQRDTEANIAGNYRLLMEALECPPGTLRAWVSQVHGRMVELIEREPENEYAETLEAEVRDRFSGQLSADALVSSVPEVLLTIRVADCVPILLASRDGRFVAAVHAGWRGVVGNVTAKAVRTLHEAGGEHATPGRLVAAIGPCISPTHFEVGEEVAAEFYQQGLETTVQPRPGAKPHIDLQEAVRLQLERAGVTTIDTHELCTYRDGTDFYSHRRDHGITGRMAAVIRPRST
jgi:YfiH family protein